MSVAPKDRRIATRPSRPQPAHHPASNGNRTARSTVSTQATRTARRIPPSPSRRPSQAPRPDPPPRRARRSLPFLVFSAVLLGGLVLGLTAFNAVLAQSSFRIGDLEKQVQALSQTYERLQLEEARLSSPGRIAESARKLGMKLPDTVEVIHVRMRRRDDGPPDRTGESARSLALKAVVGGIG